MYIIILIIIISYLTLFQHNKNKVLYFHYVVNKERYFMFSLISCLVVWRSNANLIEIETATPTFLRQTGRGPAVSFKITANFRSTYFFEQYVGSIKQYVGGVPHDLIFFQFIVSIFHSSSFPRYRYLLVNKAVEILALIA